MTNQELNRDIKRLYKKFLNRRTGDTTNWTLTDWKNYEDYDNEIKTEFYRLYKADENFDALNITTLKMLLNINNALRVIQFHVFGQIEIKL